MRDKIIAGIILLVWHLLIIVGAIFVVPLAKFFWACLAFFSIVTVLAFTNIIKDEEDTNE